MELFYKTLGEGDPLFIIHGLFGSSDNWYSLGKRFSENFKVYLIDMRNHGKSPHDDIHTYKSMADDLLELVYEEQLTYVNLIGHSMGGKVVMKFAEDHENFVEKMIVADMGIKEYKPHHDLVLEALNAFIDSDINTRKEARTLITSIVKDEGVAMFLSKNLFWKEPGVLDWKMNVPVLERSMPNILEALPHKEIESETMFLKGGKSNYIQEGDFEDIQKIFPNSILREIPDAGHWLHAEEPDIFYDECYNFFDE